MALVNCPECRTELSSMAKSCTTCGFPIGDTILGLSCSQCGRENGLTRRKARRPSLLLAAVLVQVVGAGIMALSDAPTHKGVTAVAACAFSLWFIIAALTRRNGVSDCRFCGHRAFDNPWPH